MLSNQDSNISTDDNSQSGLSSSSGPDPRLPQQFSSPLQQAALANIAQSQSPSATTGLTLNNVSAVPPPPPKGPTYVPGIGMMGPDLGGYVKGSQALQEYQLNASENNQLNIKVAQNQDYLNMAKGVLGVNMNEAAEKAKDWEFNADTQKGIMDAGAQGGYSGVIDYLKQVNPMAAMSLTANKLKLDDQIMQSDIAKAALPNQIMGVKLQAYQMMGRMASAVLNAPPEQRAGIYNSMQPIYETALPGVLPKQWGTQAIGALTLGTYQAMPENQVYYGQGEMAYMKSDIGQLRMQQADMDKRNISRSDPMQQDVQKQIDNIEGKFKQTALETGDAENQVLIKNHQDETAARAVNENAAKMIADGSKDFSSKMPQLKSLNDTAQEILIKNKNNEDTQTMQKQLYNGLATLQHSGRPAPGDFQAAATSVGMEKFDDEVESWAKGETTSLNNRQVTQAYEYTKFMINKQIQQQKAYEEQFKQLFQGPNYQYRMGPNKGQSMVNWDNLPLPTKQYQSLTDPQVNQQQMQKMAKQEIDNNISEIYNSDAYKASSPAVQAQKSQMLEQRRQAAYQKNGIK